MQLVPLVLDHQQMVSLAILSSKIAFSANNDLFSQDGGTYHAKTADICNGCASEF